MPVVTKNFKTYSLGSTEEHEQDLKHIVSQFDEDERHSFDLAMTDKNYEAGLISLELDRPMVPVDEWLDDPYYMGEVGKSIFPAWRRDLIELFETMQYDTSVIVGGIGSGKSTFSHLAVLRMLYEASCLVNPAKSYGLAPNSVIGFCNLATSKETARRVVFEGISSKMHESPYFRYEFPPIHDYKNEIIFPKNLAIIAGSSTDTSVIGMNIYGGIIDEGNFMKRKKKIDKRNATSEEQTWGSASRAGRLFQSVQRRRKSRYLKKGRLPGCLIVVSSKTTQDSFTEKIIRKAQSQGDSTCFVKDRNIIEVKREFFVDQVFKVLVGNEIYPSKILAAHEKEEDFPGGTILDIPEDLRADFEDNIDDALRDIAGVSTLAIAQFMRRPDMVDQMIDTTRSHPFVCPLMGDPTHWDSRYNYRINWDALAKRLDDGEWEPKLNPHAKRHVHFDPASTGDSFGVVIAHVAGSVAVNIGESEDVEELPYYVVDFILRIQGDKDEEILFKNVRKLCYEFTYHGFHLAEFSTDTYQCFTGDTKVKMLDGSHLTMKQLADRYGREKEFWVYSFDGNRVVPGKARNARKMGTKKVLTVELDNGEKIRCTHDHRWMLRDGSYIHAENLSPGDSLMPLYTRDTEFSRTGMKGYEEIYQPTMNNWELTHRMAGRYLWGNIRGKVIHHKGDCYCGKCRVQRLCKLNNSPNGLELMSHKDHQKLHGELGRISLNDFWSEYKSLPEDSPKKKEYKERFRSNLKKIRSRPDVKEKLASIGTERLKKINDRRWSSLEERKKQSNRIRKWNADHQNENHNRWKNELDINPIIESIKNIGITKTAIVMGFNRNSLRGMLKRRGIDTKKFGTPGKNHKVVRVLDLGEVEDVYDIEVDDHHNFALSAGVFVHNSREMIQSLREQGYKAGVYSVDSGYSSSDEDLRGAKGGQLYDRQMEGTGIDKRKQAYRYLRRVIYDGRINCYPYPVLNRELKMLEDGPDKIDHPENGSKDLADALCGAIWTLYRADYAVKPIAPMKGVSQAPVDKQHVDENFQEAPQVHGAPIRKNPQNAPRKYHKKSGPKTIAPTYKKVGHDGTEEDLRSVANDTFIDRG